MNMNLKLYRHFCAMEIENKIKPALAKFNIENHFTPPAIAAPISEYFVTTGAAIAVTVFTALKFIASLQGFFACHQNKPNWGVAHTGHLCYRSLTQCEGVREGRDRQGRKGSSASSVAGWSWRPEGRRSDHHTSGAASHSGLEDGSCSEVFPAPERADGVGSLRAAERVCRQVEWPKEEVGAPQKKTGIEIR